MEITVTAPNRIDLAGGTTDLYPLYLLMDGGCTVNAAVTVGSRVTLTYPAAAGVRVVSEDMGDSVHAETPDDLPVDGPLGLLCRAIRALPPGGPAEISTRNEAPVGSGLGASSALLVALLKGLTALRKEQMSPETLIELAASVETATIGVPAGKQDYIGALYGGISRIDFGYRGYERRPIPAQEELCDSLEAMMVLSYTGEGRASGMNNWEVTKAFIDNRDDVRAKLLQIRDIAREMAESLRSKNFDQVPALLDQEWNIRRTLAPGVSTARIEGIMSSARRAGARASKICGAGGGGCLITLTTTERRAEVERAIVAAGGELLQFRIARTGTAVI
jgi:D-glycero-alpha-D-manno-heptose-7-phosphate kinase